MEYTTPKTPQFNGIIERIFKVITEGALAMILNENFNDIAQKMLWTEAFRTYEPVQNSMETTGSMKSQFEIFYGEKPNIIVSFSDIVRIIYVTRREKVRKQMTDKTYKAIMVGYVDNHTRDTYKLYNHDTKRFIMTRDVNWEQWKITDPE